MKKMKFVVLIMVLLLCFVAVPAFADEGKILRLVEPAYEADWSPIRGGGWHARYNSFWWAAPAYIDMEGNLYPQVFVSWESNETADVWTFHLDENAVYSDGSPITAEEIKLGWELMTNPITVHSRIALFLSGVEGYKQVELGETTDLSGVKVIDDKTLEVTLTAPDPVFINRIATHLLPVIKASEVIGDDGREKELWYTPEKGVVVSGPFMPSAMDVNVGHYTFVRNPNWFGETPKLDGLDIVTVEDAQTRTVMLLNGEVDVAHGLSLPTTYDELGGGFVGTDEPATLVFQYFWINTSVPPTDDINCRKALIMSINVEEMFALSHPHGPGQVAASLLQTISEDSKLPYSYDPEGAKAAFEQCSYKDAVPRLILAGINSPQAELAGQYIAEQWRQLLGITEVELNEKWDALAKADQGKVQIFRDDAGTRFPDPVSVLQSTVYSESGNAKVKMGNYKNEEADKLIEDAATKFPTDPARLELALEAEKLVLDDYTFIPWYYEGPMMNAMPQVVGWHKNLDWMVPDPWNVDVVR